MSGSTHRGSDVGSGRQAAEAGGKPVLPVGQTPSPKPEVVGSTGIYGWGSHFPILAAAVSRTDDGVLELGAGHYSTPMLHLMCMRKPRLLVTLESDPKWMAKFTQFQTDWHPVRAYDEELVAKSLAKTTWSVVFVDHKPIPQRIKDIERFRDKATYIVVHDTQDARYEYEKILPSFKYRFDWKEYHPWTTVVSMKQPFEG